MLSCPLVIVMPVYNEQGCIEDVLREWILIARKVEGSKVLVLNDGSRDRTGIILDQLAHQHKELLVLHKQNSGHGPTILDGYQQAIERGAEWIFQVDSDDQIPAQEFWKLWPLRDQSPFILGHRKVRHDPVHRKILSFLNRCLIFLLFRIWIIDPNVPFRLMRADILKKFISIIGEHVFAPNIFLSMLAKREKISLLHIPVEHKIRTSGVPSLKPFKLGRIALQVINEMKQLRNHVK